RELGIRTSISTNITMLKGELAKQMCEGGPDILTLALDSHDKEVYEHYRKGADFKEVSGNLHDFIALTKQIGKRSHLVLQMICSPQANEKASEYKKFAEQFSGTEIRYRRYRSAKPGVQNRTKRRPCPVLWRGPAYVRADGEVFPCCILLDQSLGNVLDSDLKSMWNSSKMHQLRKMHSTGRINELRECSTCYHSDPLEYSTVTAAAGFLWNSFLIRRLIPFSERLLLLKYKIRNSIRSLKAFFRRSSLKMR
ncbi:MAG TPA: SPASM domain-containing protein, partial [Acidobacteriota bacterium]|nr:SPASM domain-containing protein [Acidobacteriota bacterium]